MQLNTVQEVNNINNLNTLSTVYKVFKMSKLDLSAEKVIYLIILMSIYFFHPPIKP